MPDCERPIDGVSLPGPALAVCEDGAVEALKHLVDEPARHDVVRLRLARVAAEHVVDGEFACVVEGAPELNRLRFSVLAHALSMTLASVRVRRHIEVLLDHRTNPDHDANAPSAVVARGGARSHHAHSKTERGAAVLRGGRGAFMWRASSAERTAILARQPR